MAVQPIPEGYHTVTPYLTVRGADRAIQFYQDAFGAEVRHRILMPDGKSVMHAELKIGDSVVMLSDEMPQGACRSPESLNGTTVMLHLYVQDSDAAFKRAVKAGARVHMPLEDTFWGDRYGVVIDPFGNVWGVSTHKEDVSQEEMARRQREFFARASKKGQ